MFNVTLNFRRGPSFSHRVNAQTRNKAYEATVKIARSSGFNESIKNYTITDEHYTDGRIWSEKLQAWVFEDEIQRNEDMNAYMTPEYH